MTDEDYQQLQIKLAEHPDCGILIANGGGIRKLRWAYGHKGKRGGVRLLYYFVEHSQQFRMLFLFAKNETSNITPQQLSQLRTIVERWEL